MESGSRLVALPAVDGRQYVYRVYARAWDLFDAAVIRQVG